MENVYSVNLFELVFHVNIPPRIALLHYPMYKPQNPQSLDFFLTESKFLHASKFMVIHFRPMQGSPIFGIREIFDCGIRDWGSFSSRNPETWALESGVQLKESGIPLMIGLSGIQVPRDKESSIQYLGTGIPFNGFQNPTLSGST